MRTKKVIRYEATHKEGNTIYHFKPFNIYTVKMELKWNKYFQNHGINLALSTIINVDIERGESRRKRRWKGEVDKSG